jgi:hypothetical protein
MDKRKPHFFVVGAAKSGTTALWNYFQHHPGIFVTNNIAIKELGFYSDEYGINDEQEYLDYFKKASQNQLIGEVCHAYLSSEKSAATIKKEIPEAKIIIILRNPISRAYSLYNWMVMHGYEKSQSFEIALEKEKSIENGGFKNYHGFKQNYLYTSSGLYYEQVKRYYDLFEKENILLLDYSDFRNDPINTLDQIQSFLGVEYYQFTKQNDTNISKSIRSSEAQFHLRNAQRKFKKTIKIVNLLKLAEKLNTKNGNVKPLNQEIKKQLTDFYSQDVLKLSKLTGINFYKSWYD